MKAIWVTAWGLVLLQAVLAAAYQDWAVGLIIGGEAIALAYVQKVGI